MRRIASTLPGAALDALAAARGGLMPWAPLFFSLGIGGYFALPAEPPRALLALAAALFLSGLITLQRRIPRAEVPAMALMLVTAGLLVATARAHLVAAPVLSFRYFGPVEGRIINIDRSFSDQLRLTLDQVVLDDTRPDRTPARVRIALHGLDAGFVPEPGLRVRLRANIAPPDGPVAPGGFDFQRLAWFSGLGGVGYSRTGAEVLGPPEPGIGLLAFRMRMDLSRGMQAAIPGQAMAFAAALMTGDRSGVAAATNDALRASNLSHMISISGLHMGLLSGFVFALCRYGMALVPLVALRVNSKKIAALTALCAATFYMILAGPDVATRRSYIMAAVMLLAVLFDRRAISLRTVAIAAMICLGLEPESLVEPGFQMSFGATTALIVGMEQWSRVEARVPVILRPVALAVASSLIAGTATAPIAAAHFNRIAEYGLLANLLAVPVMGLVVMPAGVLAAILAPFGLAWPALWAMERGCAVILLIADEVAGLNGAVITVPAPHALFLPLFGLFGAVLLIARPLWLRGAGLAGVLMAFGIWSTSVRPALLIAGDGALAGLMTADGRALSKDKGGGFVAKSWLEDDGDGADQPAAAARDGFSGAKGARTAALAGREIRVFAGKGAAGRAAGACAGGAILILSEDWLGVSGDCRIYDRRALRRSGAVALYAGPDGLQAVTARDWAGNRLWNRRPKRTRPYLGGRAAVPPAG